MPLNRRDFLKMSGLAIAGLLVAKPAVDSLMNLKEVSAETGEAGTTLSETRLAMAIDLKACKSKDGCRECIDICNRIHNVPDFGNPKDEIKWIWTTSYEGAFENISLNQDLANIPVIVTCNHCDNPPCVRVCPTKATFKRADGVVMMDYHRCIGCRYCMAACPYGSRSFNWQDPRPFIKNINPDFPTRTRGVVEKCNFCAERLANGQIPACVDVCSEKALFFGNINDSKSEISEILQSRFSIVRKPELGTKPQIYYLV